MARTRRDGDSELKPQLRSWEPLALADDPGHQLAASSGTNSPLWSIAIQRAKHRTLDRSRSSISTQRSKNVGAHRSSCACHLKYSPRANLNVRLKFQASDRDFPFPIIANPLVTGGILATDFRRAIGRCIVRNNQLKISERLRQHRVDCGRHVILAVINWQADANSGNVIQHVAISRVKKSHP